MSLSDLRMCYGRLGRGAHWVLADIGLEYWRRYSSRNYSGKNIREEHNNTSFTSMGVTLSLKSLALSKATWPILTGFIITLICDIYDDLGSASGHSRHFKCTTVLLIPVCSDTRNAISGPLLAC